MRIVIGVDWSDQAFAAVTQTFHLYRPTDVALVHGVDLGMFEHPILAEAANLQGYDDFRNAMVDAGRQLLERAATMVPSAVQSVRKINEIGSPAQVVLDSAETMTADLVVVGARGRNRLAELVLGSVSHRVLMHGSRTTLIVKGTARPLQRVLVAIQGHEDADRIVQWLTRYPFAAPVELCVYNVVMPLAMVDPYTTLEFRAWTDAAERYAEDLAKGTAAKLLGSHYMVSTKVALGDPATMVAEQGGKADLIVVASHGRKGIDRFLMGSVSHAIIHHAASPVLVVR